MITHSCARIYLQTSSSLSTAVQTVMTLKRGNRLVEYKAELAAYQERKQLKEAEYKKAYAEWKAKEEASHSGTRRLDTRALMRQICS